MIVRYRASCKLMITPDIHICSYIVIQQDPFDGVSFDMEISKSKNTFIKTSISI